MSGTKRTVIGRPAVAQITPHAIEIFGELERARRARRNAVDCKIGEQQGFCSAVSECRACRRWWDCQEKLHVELGMPLWFWPCVPRNPFPPASANARAWRPDQQKKELYDLLREARRAATASARKQKKEGALDVDVDAAAGPDERSPPLN
jgi:hypothetical protein